MPTHSAAMLLAKGQPFKVQTRPTPRPGPGELLIAVKAVALNPADCLIRDLGLFIQAYPTVLGFDIAGLVLDVGENVPSTIFQSGVTRVAGYAAFAWKSQGANYGAFQERCIVPWQHAVPLHGDMSWIRAATLPVAVQVPLMAWEALGISLAGASAVAASKNSFENTARDINEGRTRQKTQNEALLIWGASSSVGTMGVQTACLLRDDTASPVSKVYATASSSNHTYIRSLGAEHVFDHHDPDVVDAIVSAARADGMVIRHCFLAMGAIKLCQRVLQSFIHQSGKDERDEGMVVSAPPIPEDIVAIKGITTIFLQPSAIETERLTQFELCMNWLRKSLIKGSVRPSPEPQVVGKGLLAINVGLMMLMRGVSCTKLVVDLDD